MPFFRPPHGESPPAQSQTQAACWATAPFDVIAPQPSTLPVLISAPHGGRAYDPALIAELREGEAAGLRLEDRLVDELARAIAAQTGAALVVARAPRALIDLNRAVDDLDWGMVPEDERAQAMEAIAQAGGMPRPHALGSHRVRSGLGLVPRRVPGLGELWRVPLRGAALAQRIARVHTPYHASIAAQLADLRARWGTALLIDLHSMPPLSAQFTPGRAGHSRSEGPGAITAVLGDRFGASCSGALVAAAFSSLSESGWLVAHNRPYAGGYVLDRHAAPRGGVHAMQVEVDRAAYLDSRLVERGPGFDRVVAVLVALVRRLAADVAAMGAASLRGRLPPPGWAEAAE